MVLRSLDPRSLETTMWDRGERRTSGSSSVCEKYLLNHTSGLGGEMKRCERKRVH